MTNDITTSVSDGFQLNPTFVEYDTIDPVFFPAATNNIRASGNGRLQKASNCKVPVHHKRDVAIHHSTDNGNEAGIRDVPVHHSTDNGIETWIRGIPVYYNSHHINEPGISHGVPVHHNTDSGNEYEVSVFVVCFDVRSHFFCTGDMPLNLKIKVHIIHTFIKRLCLFFPSSKFGT